MTEYTQLAADTIAAVATAPGQGGIGIIRLSGPQALSIGESICQSRLRPRHAHYCRFLDQTGEPLDTGVALYFPGPHSFTGEDVVELHGHGGPTLLDILLRNCCEQGARLASAGEFSQRAYLNDKLDLTQAEAIADLINATTEAGVRSASRSLQGAFSRELDSLIEQLIALRIYVEAAIDFPEEEIDFISQGRVAEQLQGLREQLQRVLATAKQGQILRDGMKLVIAGKPNAGKSSLLNALSGEDTAIVTPIAGTTRDVLREHIQIDGMPLHIVDTAGLRDSADIVEQEGINRAWKEMQSADRILLMVDDSNADPDARPEALWPEFNQRLPSAMPVTVIHNKCDLSGNEPGTLSVEGTVHLTLSAKTGAGLEQLKSHLKHCMGFEESAEHGFMARRRHLDSLAEAASALDEGISQLETLGAGELLAEDLRHCHDALGQITGAITSDELLGKIFSSFCIGK